MKQRILYIDNLRALAIFSMIVGHIYVFTWSEHSSFWSNLIQSFNMPLFLLISGMFIRKTVTLSYLKKRAVLLLIPFLTVGSLYMFVRNAPYDLLFTESFHQGYWFLPTLFMMTVFFMLQRKIVNFIGKRCGETHVILLIIDAFITCCVSVFSLMMFYLLGAGFSDIFCFRRIVFNYPYFWLGFAIVNYKPLIQHYLWKQNGFNKIYCGLFAVFAISYYLRWYCGFDIHDYASTGKIMLIISSIVVFLCGVSACGILLVLFKGLKFSKNIQNACSYVGTHTLELYVLQYFFLPKSYSLSEIFMGGVNEIALALLQAALVVVCCIVVIKIIKRNSFLSLLFFGK